MRYKSGEFITVPNKHVLMGMKGPTQSVYLWICAHANEAGLCWPSEAKIAKEAGICRRSVSNCIKVLVQKGILKKTRRKIGGGSKENDTNLYQILLVEKVAPHAPSAHAYATDAQPLTQELHNPDAPVAEKLNPLNVNPSESNKSEIVISGEETMVAEPSSTAKTAATENPEKIPAKNPDSVDAIIAQFELVNEAYRGLFKRPPERKAARDLIERHSMEEIVAMLDFVRAHMGEEYAILVSRPVELRDKWSRIEAKRKQKPKISGGNDLIAKSNEELNNPKYGKVY